MRKIASLLASSGFYHLVCPFNSALWSHIAGLANCATLCVMWGIGFACLSEITLYSRVSWCLGYANLRWKYQDAGTLISFYLLSSFRVILLLLAPWLCIHNNALLRQACGLEHHLLESCYFIAWSSRYGQDVFLPGAGSEAEYSSQQPVHPWTADWDQQSQPVFPLVSGLPVCIWSSSWSHPPLPLGFPRVESW